MHLTSNCCVETGCPLSQLAGLNRNKSILNGLTGNGQTDST